MIIAGIASIPSREENLFQAVQSIYPYVDVIHIYLDGYDTIPDLSPFIEKIQFHSTGNSYGDAGKFMGYIEKKGEYDNSFYYLTLDDDLVVDGDVYVDMMIRGVQKYGCPVSLHGKTYGDHANNWRRPVLNYRCLDVVNSDAPVDVVGTGCLAMHSDMMNITMDMFTVKNMADIWFSYEAKKMGLPLMVLAHPVGMVKTTLPGDAPTIWKDKTGDDFKTGILNKMLALKK